MFKNILYKFIDTGTNHTVVFAFLLYLIMMTILVATLKLIFNYDSSLFLIDDGYYTSGKLFFEGKSSVLHIGRGPGLPLLFSWFNFFPVSIHPFIRLALMMFFVFLNILLVYKIFINYLSSKEIFFGLLLSLFNPLHIHFTLKSTPEVYLTTFLLLIIYYYLKILKNDSWWYIVMLFLIISVSISFKPVLFLIPIFLLLHNFIFKIKYLFFKTLTLIILTFIIFIMMINLSSTGKEAYFGLSYGGLNFIGPTFIPRAMSKTGRISLDTYDEIMNENPKNSNAVLTAEYFDDWIKNYNEKNPGAKESELIFDYIKDNFNEFVFSKFLNIFFFSSLASNFTETLINFIISNIIIIISFIYLKEKIINNKIELYVVIASLMGYFTVFLITFGYARYSIPFMFIFSIFSGCFISKKLKENVF